MSLLTCAVGVVLPEGGHEGGPGGVDLPPELPEGGALHATHSLPDGQLTRPDTQRKKGYFSFKGQSFSKRYEYLNLNGLQ